MGLKVTNNAFGALNAGISNSDTIIVLQAGQGARFPSLSAGDYFYATLIDTSNNLEIVKVTARATDTLTVVRAQDGTTARAYNVNDRFELRPTAALFNEIFAGTGLDDNAVTPRLIAPDAVTTAKILDGNVTDAKIAAMAAAKLTGRVPDANAPLGSVIQVVQVTSATAQVFSAGGLANKTFYDIDGLSLTITPSSASSKILLVGSVNVGQYTNAYNAYLRFLKNGSGVGVSNSIGNGHMAHASFRAGMDWHHINIAMSFLDTAGTTSAINYKIQINNTGGSTYPSYINRPYVVDSTWQAGTMSVLTAMEIAE